jgi:hypothetical protein
MLGPLLVQTPLTVTVSPALGMTAGMVVTACMSAMGTIPKEICSVLLRVFGSAVSLPALAVKVTLVMPGSAGAVKLTVQTMVAPTARVGEPGSGTHTAVAPLGSESTAQVGFTATLGPLLVQVKVPVTKVPAFTGPAGKPLKTACMSACGTMAMGLVLTLLPLWGSAVALPAVVVMLKGPAPGAVKVLVQVMLAPRAKMAGLLGVQVGAGAPMGRPLMTQVGVAAVLGPALVQMPVTVTLSPALTLAGTLVWACMSAWASTVKVVLVLLLPGVGSAVAVVALATMVTPPLAGAVKLTLQTMAAPRAKLATGLGGTQLTVAPGGKPVTAQAALAAALGPLLVQVTVPVTVEPAGGLAGKPLMAACMSAWGTMGRVLVWALLALSGSAVLVPAVVVMLKGPLAGAVKVLVQVMLEVMSKGLGKTAGMQVWVAPLGRPLRAQVGVAALLGPALVQVPLTVTLCPALTLAGTVVRACMSAWGTTPMDCWDWLLALKGSAVRLAAVPVTVTPPEGGIVKLMVQASVAFKGSGLAPAGQVTVAPTGMPVGVQLAFTAGLGPLFLQVRVPLTVEPAGALAGKPATTACMSAWGTMGKVCVLTLLIRSRMGSAVVEPAVVVMLKGPVAGAMKVLVQVMALPRGKLAGTGLGRHDWVAPAGRPLSVQVGAAAALGPALVQVPLTVTL